MSDGKRLALAAHLDINPNEIEESEWDDSEFTVNPKMRKRGDSPESFATTAQEIKAFLKRDGTDVATWRELVRKSLYDLRDALYRDLPLPAGIANPTGDGVPRESLAGMITRLRNKMSPERREIPPEWIEESRRVLVEYGFEDSTGFIELLLSIRAISLGRNSSSSIEALVYTMHRWSMPDAPMHKYLNGLYHILNSNEESWHTYALRQGFDGQPIEDRREWMNVDDGQYLVLTDEEADGRWEEKLERQLDEIVIPDLDPRYKKYFDRKAWIEDAKVDDRGSALSSYDGCENIISSADVWDFMCELYEEEFPNGTGADGDTVADWVFEEFDEDAPDEEMYIYRIG